jgi:CMP-N-acetylneuraminic acid synthetase
MILIKDYCVWEKNKSKFRSLYDHKNRKRRQRIKTAFLENGSFYIFKKDKFQRSKNKLQVKLEHIQ